MQARLIRSQDIVEVVTARLRQNETIFLHPRGVDEECDDAWMSLEAKAWVSLWGCWWRLGSGWMYQWAWG